MTPITRVARGAWIAYGVVAGAMALFAVIAWWRALLAGGPVLYGEGAVAHAALLTRTLDTYRDAAGATFTAANYPPLYFIGIAIGEPFATGRLLSIGATLAVAGLIVWLMLGCTSAISRAFATGAGWATCDQPQIEIPSTAMRGSAISRCHPFRCPGTPTKRSAAIRREIDPQTARKESP